MAPAFPAWALIGLHALCACNAIHFNGNPHIVTELSRQQKRQNSHFPILGVTGVEDSGIYPRREIRDLEANDPDQWNIYLLGLQRFQSVHQDDKLSYFQIAGIHGKPYVAWDGAEGDPSIYSHYSGYCAHDNNLFPTWHRPYLALFEEVLFLNARQAIAEFPAGALKDRYWKALPRLRIPYWDWASPPLINETTMPLSVQRPAVNVTLFNGTIEIPNPLHSYIFHPTPNWEAEFDERWKLWNSTMRDPDSNEANATSRNDQVAEALDGNRPNMQERVFNLLALEHGYLNMSNKLQMGDSLESIHGTIHDTCGMNGTMTWLWYSAFDPIFWLHHANVDRLLAIWQELNKDSWVTSFTNPYATFAFPPNTTADGKTPLKPFHNDDSGNFWTSDGVRSWQTFGYTYPEFIGLNENITLISRVNALYGPKAVPARKRGIATTGAPDFSGQRQYSLNIQVREAGFPGSLKIILFLGEVKSNNVRAWIDDKNFVGVTSILATSKEGMQKANSIIPLTAALESKVKNSELANIEEGTVAEYLWRNLNWKIVKADSDITDCEGAPEIKVWVSWQEIEPARSPNEFPRPKSEASELLCANDGNKGRFTT